MTDKQQKKSINQSSDSQDELDVLKQQLEDSQKRAEEYLDGWKRAKADYANTQRDSQKRLEELLGFAKASFVSDIVPIFENFKQALNHIPAESQADNWAVGLGHIRKQFDDLLKEMGVEAIKTIGEKFDPQLHEAVVCEEHQDTQSDMIFEEISAGYTLNGKVIIPAKVKVAK